MFCNFLSPTKNHSSLCFGEDCFLEDVHLKIRFTAEGKVKGKRHWEGRVGFGRYCANVCHEVLLMQLVAESH